MDANTHWRDSARMPKFFVLDYRVALLFLFMIIAPSVVPDGYVGYVFYFICLLVSFFGIIEYFGFTLSISLRWFRNTFISGKYKKTRSWWREG